MNLSKDQITNIICLFGLVFTICIVLTILLKSIFHASIDLAFIKDIFSIGTTIFAALVAVALYSDWREQHNKIFEASLAFKIVEKLRISLNCYRNFSAKIIEFSDLEKSEQYNFKVDDKTKEYYFELYGELEYLLYEISETSKDEKISIIRLELHVLHEKLKDIIKAFDNLEIDNYSLQPDLKIVKQLDILNKTWFTVLKSNRADIHYSGKQVLILIKMKLEDMYGYLTKEKIKVQ